MFLDKNAELYKLSNEYVNKKIKKNKKISFFFFNFLIQNLFILFYFSMYSINRLYELQKEKLSIFNNNCGGRFLNENWMSAYPTDSQVLYLFNNFNNFYFIVVTIFNFFETFRRIME